MKKELAKLNQRIQKSLKDKRPIFKEIMRRYEDNEDQAHMKYSPSKRTFYWWQVRNGKKINKLKGHSDQIIKGVLYPSRIKEGYVDVVVNEVKDVGNGLHQEYSIENFAHYITIDHIPAILREDVVLTGNGNIQFAVKSVSFRTAAFRQYYNTAVNILKIKNPLTLQQFKKYLPGLKQMDELTDKIFAVIQKEATKQVQKEVETQLKKLYKQNEYDFFLTT